MQLTRGICDHEYGCNQQPMVKYYYDMIEMHAIVMT